MPHTLVTVSCQDSVFADGVRVRACVRACVPTQDPSRAEVGSIEQLKLSLDKVHVVAMFNNEAIRTAESKTRLHRLQHKFTEPLELVPTGTAPRHVLRETEDVVKPNECGAGAANASDNRLLRTALHFITRRHPQCALRTICAHVEGRGGCG